jgi:hypothetical protein
MKDDGSMSDTNNKRMRCSSPASNEEDSNQVLERKKLAWKNGPIRGEGKTIETIDQLNFEQIDSFFNDSNSITEYARGLVIYFYDEEELSESGVVFWNVSVNSAKKTLDRKRAELIKLMVLKRLDNQSEKYKASEWKRICVSINKKIRDFQINNKL